MMHGKSYGKMSKDDKMYQAEDDVRTLIAYGEIMKDKPRYKAAMAMAKKKAEALNYAAGGMDMGKMSMAAYSKMRKKETAKKGDDY